MPLVEHCCLISLSCLGDSEMLHQKFMSALSVGDKNFVGRGRKLVGAKKIRTRLFMLIITEISSFWKIVLIILPMAE